METFGINAAVRWEARRWRHRHEFKKFQCIAVTLAELLGHTLDRVHLPGAQLADVHLRQQRQIDAVALQDPRCLFRIEAALQVPRSDAKRSRRGRHACRLLQFDLMECGHLRVGAGMRLTGWRQIEKACALRLCGRCQPINRFAPDADDRIHGSGPHRFLEVAQHLVAAVHRVVECLLRTLLAAERLLAFLLDDRANLRHAAEMEAAGIVRHLATR